MNLIGMWGVFFLTFKESIRAKWLVLFSVIFFLLSVNLPSIVNAAAQGAAQNDIIGATIPPSFLSVLAALAFPIVPLLALPMGATSIVDDRESGTLQYVLSNPISKSEYFIGKAAGLTISTTLAVVFGFGGAAVIAYGTNFARYSGILWLIVFALLLNLVMLSLGFIISNFSKRKVTALVIGIFTWLLYTGLSDVDQLVIMVNLRFGEFAAVALVLADPIQQAIVLTGIRLGACGAFDFSSCGGPGLVAYFIFGSNVYSVLLVALLAWVAAFFTIGFLVFRRQDLG